MYVLDNITIKDILWRTDSMCQQTDDNLFIGNQSFTAFEITLLRLSETSDYSCRQVESTLAVIRWTSEIPIIWLKLRLWTSEFFGRQVNLILSLFLSLIFISVEERSEWAICLVSKMDKKDFHDNNVTTNRNIQTLTI